MHGCEQAGPDDERPEQRKREGQDGKQDGPAFERIALFSDDGRMQQRGAKKPGHEAYILDRVPEPPATPAQFIIGPPRSKSDTGRKADPRGQCPRADPSGPRRIDATLQKSRNGKGKHDGEADIPEI